MLLSDHEIIDYRKRGLIKIDPFDERRLNTNSYDLTIGPSIARYRDNLELVDLRNVSGPDVFVVSHHERDILIRKGETILAHTNEAVGGTSNGAEAVNSSIQATSTWARFGLTVCRDAGWGDVGYMQPYTLEVTNHMPCDVLVPVGAVIAQVIFWMVAAPSKVYGRDQGSYGVQQWAPQDMLPKKVKL